MPLGDGVMGWHYVPLNTSTSGPRSQTQECKMEGTHAHTLRKNELVLILPRQLLSLAAALGHLILGTCELGSCEDSEPSARGASLVCFEVPISRCPPGKHCFLAAPKTVCSELTYYRQTWKTGEAETGWLGHLCPLPQSASQADCSIPPPPPPGGPTAAMSWDLHSAISGPGLRDLVSSGL